MTINFYKKYAVISLVVLGIVFFNNYLANNFLQRMAYYLVGGSGAAIDKNLLSFSGFSKGIFSNKQLVEENTRIKDENNVLNGQLAGLESIKRENQVLRDELGVTQRRDLSLVIVQIFNIQRGMVSSTALISKGSKDGIVKAMPVISTGNILVGIVDQVFDNSALVLLLDDPRVKVSGRIEGSSVLVGAKGELQNQLGLDLIAAGDDVKVGNTIVTSGLDGLPESLIVSKVTGVKISSGALFKTVTATPLFDPSLGSSLFVIIK